MTPLQYTGLTLFGSRYRPLARMSYAQGHLGSGEPRVYVVRSCACRACSDVSWLWLSVAWSSWKACWVRCWAVVVASAVLVWRQSRCGMKRFPQPVVAAMAAKSFSWLQPLLRSIFPFW